jgi:flagellar biosynthesis GTPase FlhF
VLGEGCLGNVWLVVTASGADLSRDRAAQQAWVRQSRSNRHFDEMVGRLGADRIVFVENPPDAAGRSAREEEFNAQRRDEARAALLRVITANAPTRYTIAELEQAQEAYDRQCRELEARAADEARRVREEQVRAATEQERAQLEQRLREIEEQLQRQLGEVRATQQRAVEQAAVTYVQHKTRALDVVMEGLKVVGMVVSAGKCVLQ